MDFSFLNTIEPCLITASNINKLNCPFPGTSHGKRTVEHFELDYITWGEGYIVTDGKRIPARKGDLFFRKPGMVVEGFSPYYCYYIVFNMFRNETSLNNNGSLISDTNLVKRNADDVFEFPAVMNIKNSIFLEELFLQLFNEYIVQREVSPFITRTILMQILLYMYNQWMSKNRFENSRKSLRQNYKRILLVKEYIDRNSHQRITLDELAEKSGFSRYFFCRIFKEIIGESPIIYVNRCRINNAKRLLIETEKSVKEILYECGFDNESHFFKLFKMNVGVSPAIYGQNSKTWKDVFQQKRLKK